MTVRYLLPVLLIIITGCPPGKIDTETNPSALTSYHHALGLIQSARAAMHKGGRIDSLPGIILTGKGTYDLSTRLQGMRPDGKDPYPILEHLEIDLNSGRVMYESDTHVNADAREHIRYTYDGDNRMLFLDLYNGFAFWDSRPGLNRQAQRYSNMVPMLLLEEALKHRGTLNYLGNDRSGRERVSFTSPDYGPLTLFIDPETGYLSGVAYLQDMPLYGDTAIRWEFKHYRTAEGIGPYPSGYTIHLGQRLLKEITYTSIQVSDPELTGPAIPDSIDLPNMPDPPAAEEPVISSSQPTPRDPVELATGVYVMPHIRPGFHPMIIEFSDFLMVIDTPAGWLEIHQLPAMQWVEGATSSSTGRKLKNAINRQFPGKPVRYVALTHFHSDHAGGIRPFIEAGAIVLASPVTAPLIERAAQHRFTLHPDELTGTDITPKIEIIHGNRTISDSTMRVRLIDVGSNPHAEGMLVAYLPEQKILYQSDLFEPISINAFPSKSRLPVMRWFVDWLDNSNLDVEKIYAIHAGLRVTEEHLEAIRERLP